MEEVENLLSRKGIVHTKYILLQQNKVIDLKSFVTWFPWKAFISFLSYNQRKFTKYEGFRMFKVTIRSGNEVVEVEHLLQREVTGWKLSSWGHLM